MSWHYESETGDIVIDSFEKGIGKSPYDGFQNILGNITGTLGEVSVGYPLTAATTSGDTLGNPIARATYTVLGNAVAYLILDALGHIFVSTTINGTYSSTSAITTSAQSTDGLIAWKGYVFHFRNGNIDYATINSAGTVGSWVTGTNWQTSVGNAGLPSFVFVGRDDVIYFCNAQYVGSIIEKAGATFDPADPTTYTYNKQALALPSFDIAVSLQEQGTNLLIGGAQDAVYVWDRISPTFNNRIFLADRYAYRMVKANTNVFIFCGHRTTGGRGRVYITNGSQADLFFKFPDFMTNRQDPIYIWGDAIYHRNMLIFSLYTQTNNTSPTVLLTLAGVFAVELENNAFSTLSGLGAAEVASVLIPDTSGSAAGQAGMGYIAGIYNASTLGSNTIKYSTTAAGTGTGTISTDYIPIGTFLDKRTIKSLEYKLRTGLASGESISVTMVDEAGNGVTVINDSTVGMMSNVGAAGIEKSQWLYLTVSTTGNAATSGVRLKELRLHLGTNK